MKSLNGFKKLSFDNIANLLLVREKPLKEKKDLRVIFFIVILRMTTIFSP